MRVESLEERRLRETRPGSAGKMVTGLSKHCCARDTFDRLMRPDLGEDGFPLCEAPVDTEAPRAMPCSVAGAGRLRPAQGRSPPTVWEMILRT